MLTHVLPNQIGHIWHQKNWFTKFSYDGWNEIFKFIAIKKG